MFGSASCLKYRLEHGDMTEEICFPSGKKLSSIRYHVGTCFVPETHMLWVMPTSLLMVEVLTVLTSKTVHT